MRLRESVQVIEIVRVRECVSDRESVQEGGRVYTRVSASERVRESV